MTASGPSTDPTPEAAPTLSLVDKARAVSAKMRRLRHDFDGAHRLAHDAQVREALTRTALSAALGEALIARAELEARLRTQAVAAFKAGRSLRMRRHNRLSQLLDKVLAKLGPLGKAAVIARSGVWRASGRPLADLRRMVGYAWRGARADVQPAAALDQAWYLSTYPDVAASGLAPLVHYLLRGGREGRSPAPLFDAGWYTRQNAEELAATSLTPLEHYVRIGAMTGRSPHPLFDAAYYLSQGPVLQAGYDPLSHYMRVGWRAGLSPHPAFSPSWYAKQAGRPDEQSPLSHYLAEGWKQGLSPHPLFDTRWYLARHPDLAASGAEPFTHFLVSGGRSGHDPGPWFDAAGYMAQRGAALPDGLDPLTDYLLGGAWAVAEARPDLTTARYLAENPGLARTGVTPLEHLARRNAP